jgi:hypothetical protein
VFGTESAIALAEQVDVKKFQAYLEKKGKPVSLRPWQFEVDPFPRHSVIAASGIRFNQEKFS